MKEQERLPLSSTTDQESLLTVAPVRFEHLADALGLGMAHPRLSWSSETGTQNWHQIAYELKSYTAAGQLREQTGRVESDQSVLVPWPFAWLSSCERVLVRVRVWGTDGQVSPWSVLSQVEAGLLVPAVA